MSTALVASLRLARAGFLLEAAFELESRGVTALVGPSGSGKTSLLRCLAGLERGAAGSIHVGGEPWLDSARGIFLAPHRRGAGLVFQDSRLFPHLDVRGNLEFARRRAPIPAPGANLEDVAGWLQVAHLLERRPGEISGGEARRVAIARALLASPSILLLDEPLSGLDEERKSEMLQVLASLAERLALPMVYVSHSASEVARIAARAIVLREGKVQAVGEIADLTSRLDLPWAREEGAAVALAGQVVDVDRSDGIARIRTPAGDLLVPAPDAVPGRAIRVVLSARDVSIALEAGNPSSILNRLAATVLSREDDERGRTMLQLASGQARILARITRRSADALGLVAGREVVAQVKSVALF